ncbi:MAG: hypothetical protein Q9226_007623, partial [Calogaya cf. arnoldii]
MGIVVPGSPRRESSPEGELQQFNLAHEDNRSTAPSISEADVQEAVDAQLLGEGEEDVEADTHHAEEGSISDSNARYYSPRPWDYHTPSPPLSATSDLTLPSSLSDVPSSFDERSEPDLTRAQSPTAGSEGLTEILDRHYEADMSDFARDRLEELLGSEELQEKPEPFSDSTSPLLNALNITKLQGFIKHATQKANAVEDPIMRQAMITLLKRSAHNPDLLNLFAATARREKTTAQTRDFEILLSYERSRLNYESKLPEWYADLPLGTRQKLALSEEPFDGSCELHDTSADVKDLWDEVLLTQYKEEYNSNPVFALPTSKVLSIVSATRKRINELNDSGETTTCLAMNLREQAMIHPFVMALLDEPARAKNATREKIFQVYLKFAKQEVEKAGSRTKWFAQPNQSNTQDNAESQVSAQGEAQDSAVELPPPNGQDKAETLVEPQIEAQVEAQALVEAQLEAPIEAPVEAPIEAQDSDAELPPRPPRKKRRVGSTAVDAKTVLNEASASSSPDVRATESPYSLRAYKPHHITDSKPLRIITTPNMGANTSAELPDRTANTAPSPGESPHVLDNHSDLSQESLAVTKSGPSAGQTEKHPQEEMSEAEKAKLTAMAGGDSSASEASSSGTTTPVKEVADVPTTTPEGPKVQSDAQRVKEHASGDRPSLMRLNTFAAHFNPEAAPFMPQPTPQQTPQSITQPLKSPLVNVVSGQNPLATPFVSQAAPQAPIQPTSRLITQPLQTPILHGVSGLNPLATPFASSAESTPLNNTQEIRAQLNNLVTEFTQNLECLKGAANRLKEDANEDLPNLHRCLKECMGAMAKIREATSCRDDAENEDVEGDDSLNGSFSKDLMGEDTKDKKEDAGDDIEAAAHDAHDQTQQATSISPSTSKFSSLPTDIRTAMIGTLSTSQASELASAETDVDVKAELLAMSGQQFDTTTGQKLPTHAEQTNEPTLTSPTPPTLNPLAPPFQPTPATPDADEETQQEHNEQASPRSASPDPTIPMSPEVAHVNNRVIQLTSEIAALDKGPDGLPVDTHNHLPKLYRSLKEVLKALAKVYEGKDPEQAG